jgi:hypothetical protein
MLLGAAAALAAPVIAHAQDGPSPLFKPNPLKGALTVGLPAFEQPPFVRPREAWGAGPPVQALELHTPHRVSIHHTGAVYDGRPGSEQYLRNIQAFHIGPQREWEDIAYHYLVDLEGIVWAGRPPTVRGNPSRFYDPSGYVHICMLGDYGVQQPSEAQIAAVAKTAAWLYKRFEMPRLPVTAHRNHVQTTCPGENMFRTVQDGSLTRLVEAQLG